MRAGLTALFWRELKLARQSGARASTGVIFFLVVAAIFPFAVGPDLNLLARIGPAILWIAVLLATLLGLDRLFQADHEDGSLDLMLTGEAPLEAVVIAKCAAHWLTTALPLVVVAPLFGLAFAQDSEALLRVTLSLFVGTPALTLIGAVGAAVTVSLRRGGLLIAVLVLPITIPVLIFGVSAAGAGASDPVPFAAPLAILSALSLAALAGAPFATAAALRYGGE